MADLRAIARLIEAGHTQAEIARRLGVSRQYIWQILMRADSRCVRCAFPTDGATYCERHAKEDSDRVRRYYARKREEANA